MANRHFGSLFFQIIFYLLATASSSMATAQSFVGNYGPTKSPRYEAMQNQLRQTGFLEQISEALSKGIALQDQVMVATAECGTENAFYLPQQRTIVLCLELFTQVIEGIHRDFANIATADEINQTTSGALLFILMHEIGHMMIDRFQLPVLGREEDAADQIGAFFLLNNDMAQQTLPGALWFFRSETLFYTRRHFSDEHSVGPQRQSNLACWAYGKDEARFRHLLNSSYLTKSRAERCSKEYEQLDSSVRRLLDGKVQLPPP